MPLRRVKSARDLNLESRVLLAEGPRSRAERPLSAARKAPAEERDPEETACSVRQAVQRENESVQTAELCNRNTVRLLNSAH